MNEKLKSFLELTLIALLFILASYLIQTNLTFFQTFLADNLTGMLIYILILIIATVIAPVSAFPLIPIASNIWGTNTSATLNIIGWLIGSMIAFYLSREYGVNLIKKIIPLNQINKLEKRIPKENVFWSIVFLRMAIPVDILSYALGLFSKISYQRYFWATLLGITPFAFIFAYLGNLPVYYQIIAAAIGITIISIGFLIKNKLKKQ